MFLRRNQSKWPHQKRITDMICIYIYASFCRRKINLTNLSYTYVSQNTIFNGILCFGNPQKHLPNFQHHERPWSNGSRDSHSCSFNRLSLMTSDNLDGSSKKSPRKTHPALNGNGFTFNVQPTRRRTEGKGSSQASSSQWNPMGFLKVWTHMNSIDVFCTFCNGKLLVVGKYIIPFVPSILYGIESSWLVNGLGSLDWFVNIILIYLGRIIPQPPQTTSVVFIAHRPIGMLIFPIQKNISSDPRDG